MEPYFRSEYMAKWYYLTLGIDCLVGLAVFAVCLSLILWLGLSPRHSRKSRMIAAMWLTGCICPLNFLVLPHFFQGFYRPQWSFLGCHLLLGSAGCLLFWLVFGKRSELGKRSMYRDLSTVSGAYLFSVTMASMAMTRLPF